MKGATGSSVLIGYAVFAVLSSRAELRGDALGGVDGPLLVAVQDARRRDAERFQARAQPVGLLAPLRADMALRVLLGRQRVDVVYEVDFHGVRLLFRVPRGA